MRHENYMRLAIESARTVPAHPFGAVIIRPATGECLAMGANRLDENPVLHGEIDAINRCAAAHPGIDWTDLALYTTAEPCPMCQSAIAWAGIPEVYYGTSIPRLRETGWRQIDIRAEEVIRRTPFRDVRIVGAILEAECNALFAAAAVTRRTESGRQPVIGRRASDTPRS
jgi:tRNA(adenine34) deaminase